MASENNQNPKKIKISPWLIYGAVALLFLFISFITGGSSFEEPLKTSSSKFNEYLDKGQVGKVLGDNITEAEGELTPEALKDPIHKAVANDLLNRPNKGPHYTLEIGNDELFQNKLESAVKAKKLREYSFLPKSNWGDLLQMILLQNHLYHRQET
jgi:cell division protease FtsH